MIGSGPNGLAAAITLAQAGRSVLVLEAAGTPGGGLRSAPLTLPGFLHDVCSAIHPLAVGSPFFRALGLERRGLEMVQPPSPLAHPLDDGTAVMLERSVEDTGAGLGADGRAWARLMTPLAGRWPELADGALAPLRLPRHPILMARFGALGLQSAAGLARARFDGARARALFAGIAAHSMLPLDQRPSAAFGLILAVLGHACGWPLVRGGSERISDALADELRGLGGQIVTGRRVDSLDELGAPAMTLADLTPRELLRVAGHRMPDGYRRRLARYRYGPGVFKLDWALAAPIPWRAPACGRAATLHLGGTFEEIAGAEAAVAAGRPVERPFVILVQPTRFDPGRAPVGKHTAWAYCHVPNGSPVDMTAAIERQVERFAPGFGETILARHALGPAGLERYNANYAGGDINGGRQDLGQLFTRPVTRFNPYTTPVAGLYLCSAATPPGGGVHGMCGVWAARAALARERG